MMPPLVVRAETLDVEAIQQAIRERVRARTLAASPSSDAERADEQERALAPLDDWNFPRPVWRAMWPPALEPWNLEEDFPIRSHRAGTGPLLVAGKRLLRQVLRLLLRPLLSQQVEINRTLALTAHRLARESAEQRLRMAAIEGRIARMASAMRQARGEEPPLLIVEDSGP